MQVSTNITHPNEPDPKSTKLHELNVQVESASGTDTAQLLIKVYILSVEYTSMYLATTTPKTSVTEL